MSRVRLLLPLATAALLIPSATASASISTAEAKAWHPGVKAAKQFAKARSTDVSFAIYDMRDRLAQEGGAETYVMASTFKVMLLAAYLRQDSVANRDLTRDERSLLVPMIRRSDNGAATEIRNRLGRGPVERLAHDAGMHDFTWNDIWGYCRTSPIDQARFLRRIRGLLPDRHRAFAMRQLESISDRHRWGIAKVKPQGWSLYFKGGWGLKGYKVEHQVVLLRHGSRKIGIAVYTQRNPSRAYGRATLEGVFARLLKDLPA